MVFGPKIGTRGQGQDISRTCPGLVQLRGMQPDKDRRAGDVAVLAEPARPRRGGGGGRAGRDPLSHLDSSGRLDAAGHGTDGGGR